MQGEIKIESFQERNVLTMYFVYETFNHIPFLNVNLYCN